ncbi:MAG: cyclic nucleotide-binding domain-containing protein [Deltaproteobacteria bacterium]|nr:cyclic nucleotide-binding domain-containing protein [Deltaproteobacteria bacterium]
MTTAQVLQEIGLFKPLSDDQLKSIIELVQTEKFEAGKEVYHQGQQADTVYVLLDGSFSLTIEAPEELDVMADTVERTGSILGMTALMKSGTYNETVTCTRSATVLAIESMGLQEIIRRALKSW